MKILRNQKGFTLIELVLIIIILGVLAAVAIPRFVNLQSEASAAANVGWIGGIRSGISIRFAEESLRGVSAVPVDVVTVAGPALPASATRANIETLNTGSKPTSLTNGASTACPAGTGNAGWTGLSPTTAGGPPATQEWVICPGANTGDPARLVCTAAAQQC